MSSNHTPLCHNVQISGSINQPSVASHSVIMEEQQSVRDFTIVDTKQYSDKVPLTELHLCRFEDCHGAKKGDSESPLEPVKTRALYALLLLAATWAVMYIVLAYFQVV